MSNCCLKSFKVLIELFSTSTFKVSFGLTYLCPITFLHLNSSSLHISNFWLIKPVRQKNDCWNASSLHLQSCLHNQGDAGRWTPLERTVRVKIFEEPDGAVSPTSNSQFSSNPHDIVCLQSKSIQESARTAFLWDGWSQGRGGAVMMDLHNPWTI